MIMDKEFLKKLRSAFNLNEYEVKIWTALLSKGVATAGELAEISEVPRSRSYDVLESLEKRGFAIVKLGKPIKYIAVKPSNILNRVKKDVIKSAESHVTYMSKVEKEGFFNELSLLYKNGIEYIDPNLLSGLIQGRKNLYSQIENMIGGAKKSVIIATSKNGLKRKMDIFGPVLRKVISKGIPVKITSSGKNNEIDGIELKNIGDFDARFVLVDNKQLIFMLTGDDTHDNFDSGIWINSPFFVNALSSMFDTAWKNN